MGQFVDRVTIHGRRLGISTTGGLIGRNATSTASGWDAAAQMWGAGLHNSVSSSAATIGNAGVTSITAASATAQRYTIAAPVLGIRKIINLDTSASEISFAGPTTTVIFQTTKAGVGSTLFMTLANLAGKNLSLLGMSTLRYTVLGSTVGAIIG